MNDRRTELIILSERDINKDTVSPSTDGSNLFNLTPEIMNGLTKENEHKNNNGLPPRTYIPFEIDENNISFQSRGTNNPIKIKRKDGSYQSNLNTKSSIGGKMSCNTLKRSTESITQSKINSQRISMSSERSKKNIFARPQSVKGNGS